VELRLLFDTGAGQTLITPAAAARLGCQPFGHSGGLRMTGERVDFRRCRIGPLELGGRQLGGDEIAVWDVGSVLPKELPPIDGVLALDVLDEQPFTLDLASRALTLETAPSFESRIAGMRPVRARVATGVSGGELTLFVHGGLDQPGWFLFDSGNLDLTLAAPHMLQAAVPQEETETVIELSGLARLRAPLRVRDIIYDGALSESLLRGWIWSFRLASAELWAAPAAGP
jgi:hypothetical protein